MFRFLIPPVIFLLLKHFAITSDETMFTYFSSLSAEDTSQRDALIISVIFILVTAIAAAIVVGIFFLLAFYLFFFLNSLMSVRWCDTMRCRTCKWCTRCFAPIITLETLLLAPKRTCLFWLTGSVPWSCSSLCPTCSHSHPPTPPRERCVRRLR